jgi:hypothetical protein
LVNFFKGCFSLIPFCLEIEMVTHGDQVSLLFLGTFLIPFHCDARFGYLICVVPHLAISSPYLAELPEKDSPRNISYSFWGVGKVEWGVSAHVILWLAVTSSTAAISPYCCFLHWAGAKESQFAPAALDMVRPSMRWGRQDGLGQSGSRSTRLQTAVGSPLPLVSCYQREKVCGESNWCPKHLGLVVLWDTV